MSGRWAVRLVLVAVLYYGGAQLGLSLALYNSQVTPFWPPTGIAIAALLLWGRSMWPALAVAALAVNMPLSDGLATPALIAVGNVLAPLLAATLLDRAGFRRDEQRLRDAGLLVGIGGLAMAVSATVGVGALLLEGLPSDKAAWVWTTWWTGDAAGALIVTPCLLALHQQLRGSRPSPARAAEAAALLLLTGAASLVGFRSHSGLSFLVFALLAVTAVRFQQWGAAPAALIASLAATSAAADGAGVFAGLGDSTAMLVLQAFNACVIFTTYLLGAVTADRERANLGLARQGIELERLVDARTLELSEALDRLALAQQIAGMGSFVFDLHGDEAHLSEEFCRLLQLPPGSAMSMEAYLALSHPDDLADVLDLVQRTVATGEPFTLDHRLRRSDGTYRWLQCQGQVGRDRSGAIVSLQGTTTDIDELKGAERRFKQLVEMAPDAMVFVDSSGLITQVNRQTETMFGWARAELEGQPIEVLIPERYADTHQHHRRQFGAHPGLRPMGRGLDLQARRRDGSEFPVEILLSPLETDQGTLVSAAIRDVTDRKEQQEELAYRGLHDSLTGLPNRLLLADRLSRALTGLRRTPGLTTAVLFLDLDHFKWVNDSLGHDAGDALLRTIAERLLAAVRPGDTVARFGGDEFVVLSAGLASREEASQLADRLRLAVSTPVALAEGHTVVPTVSVGLTVTQDPEADPAALLRDADAAMYRAKEHGRDRTAVFAPEIHTQMSSRLATAGGLRAAIEGGELRIHYQPILSLLSGAPRSVEALVRWQHPERGLLLPGAFLGPAEETGQIGALDRAVILSACREFGALVASQPTAADLTLNVNVSLQHLAHEPLRDTLLEALEVGGLRPAQLTVEVTESADLSSDQFAGLVDMVKGLGIKVAIDDFGTGFSALSRLNVLGVDTIKVDRSFVTGVHTSARAQALVAAMLQLATALEANVIAEGIELPEQAAALRSLGCAGGQGFLWAKGMPMDELTAWLTRPAPRVPAPRPLPYDEAAAPGWLAAPSA